MRRSDLLVAPGQAVALRHSSRLTNAGVEPPDNRIEEVGDHGPSADIYLGGHRHAWQQPDRLLGAAHPVVGQGNARLEVGKLRLSGLSLAQACKRPG